MLCGVKQIQSRADAILRDTLKTEGGKSGVWGCVCVPPKQTTSSRACCVGFTELFAWRKTCILVACAFLHLSSLKQPLLPGGRDKTSQEGLQQF